MTQARSPQAQGVWLRWLAGVSVGLLCAACSNGDSHPPGLDNGDAAHGAGGSSGAAGSAGQSDSGTGGVAGEAGTAGAQDAGDEDGSDGSLPGSDAEAGVCPQFSPEPNCQSCLAYACTSDCLACGDNASCLGLWSCVTQCSAPDCIQGCENQYPDGIAPLNQLLGANGCMAQACYLPCGITPPPSEAGIDAGFACGFSQSSESCQLCLNQSCALACQACTGDVECTGFRDCVALCASGDSDCVNNCRSQHGAGEQEYEQLLGAQGCGHSECQSVCGL